MRKGVVHLDSACCQMDIQDLIRVLYLEICDQPTEDVQWCHLSIWRAEQLEQCAKRIREQLGRRLEHGSIR